MAGALTALAEVHAALPLPGYTHLQRAMPSSVPLWAGGFAAELADDAMGLLDCLRRLDLNPLGSLGYGTPGSAGGPRGDAAIPGVRAHPRAGDRGPALPREGGGAQVLFEVVLLASDLGRLWPPTSSSSTPPSSGSSSSPRR